MISCSSPVTRTGFESKQEVPRPTDLPTRWSRRQVLSGLTLAGTAGYLGLRPGLVAAEPAPETKTIRIALPQDPAVCLAPLYIAEELLQNEGFTEIRYVKTETWLMGVGSEQTDVGMGMVTPIIVRWLDSNSPLVVLSGLHTGCFELLGTERVHSILDLKGKTVGIERIPSTKYRFLAVMAAYVGLDPRRDIHWLVTSPTEAVQLLARGEIDAYMGFAPEPQEIRAMGIGRVVVNSAMDRPWSQYFCCMVAARREFVQQRPVATKRALRAFLKAADLCASEPEWVSQSMVEQGVATKYEHILQSYKETPYLYAWRDFNPEDSLRFYALRLHELGMIKSSPQKLLAQGTDWRFLKALKQEMKG